MVCYLQRVVTVHVLRHCDFKIDNITDENDSTTQLSRLHFVLPLQESLSCEKQIQLLFFI